MLVIGDSRIPDAERIRAECTQRVAADFGTAFESEAAQDAVLLCTADKGYQLRSVRRGWQWYEQRGYPAR